MSSYYEIRGRQALEKEPFGFGDIIGGNRIPPDQGEDGSAEARIARLESAVRACYAVILSMAGEAGRLKEEVDRLQRDVAGLKPG